MRWLAFPVLALLLLLSVAAKPRALSSGLVVTYEDVQYGYEGDPIDGCLGADESLYVIAEGNLESAQTFSYSNLPSCTGNRHFYLRAQPLKGQGDVRIWIDAQYVDSLGRVHPFHLEDVTQGSQDWAEVCLALTGPNYLLYWSVGAENVGDHTARSIYFQLNAIFS